MVMEACIGRGITKNMINVNIYILRGDFCNITLRFCRYVIVLYVYSSPAWDREKMDAGISHF